MTSNYKKMMHEIYRLGRLVCVCIMLLSSGNLYALEVGGMNVYSSVNQELDVRVGLISPTSDEIATLNVTLADESVYESLGAIYPYDAQQYQFALEEQGDDYFIAVTSPDPIVTPFIHLILDLSWAGGQVIREYTVLLDQPIFAEDDRSETPVISLPPNTPEETAIKESLKESSIVNATEPVASEEISDEATNSVAETQPSQQQQQEQQQASNNQADTKPEQAEPQPKQEPQSNNVATLRQVNVIRGDTLSGIVAQLDVPLTSVFSAYQAILEANPKAFLNGNMNVLLAEETLTIPSLEQLNSYSDKDARKLFVKQAKEHEANTLAGRQSNQDTTQPQVSNDQQIQQAKIDKVLSKLSKINEALPATGTGAKSAEENAKLQISQNAGDDDQSQTSNAQQTKQAKVNAVLSKLSKINESLLAADAESEQIAGQLDEQTTRSERVLKLLEIEEEKFLQQQQTEDKKVAPDGKTGERHDTATKKVRHKKEDLSDFIAWLMFMLLILIAVFVYLHNKKKASRALTTPAFKSVDADDGVDALEAVTNSDDAEPGQDNEVSAQENSQNPSITETALDLARAYVKIGQIEEAQQFIDEVMQDGTEEQKQQARGLLDVLNLNDKDDDN